MLHKDRGLMGVSSQGVFHKWSHGHNTLWSCVCVCVCVCMLFFLTILIHIHTNEDAHKTVYLLHIYYMHVNM